MLLLVAGARPAVALVPLLQARLDAPAEFGGSSGRFGRVLALSPDAQRLAVGASIVDRPGPGNRHGAVVVYLRDGEGGGWAEERVEFGRSDSSFGSSLVFGGDGLLYVGAPALRFGGRIYQLDPAGVGEPLEIAEGVGTTNLGSSLAIDGDTLVSGADGADVEGEDTGEFYVFERAGETWEQVARRTPENILNRARFGTALALDGDELIIGAYSGGTGKGTFYTYERVVDVIDFWGETGAYLPDDDGDEVIWFGGALDRSGDTLAVSASAVAVDGADDAGAVFLYRRDPAAGGWAATTRVTAGDAERDDRFGLALALDGDVLVVGAPEEDEGGEDAGAVYFFRRDEGAPEGWGQTFKLVAPDAEEDLGFGSALLLAGETLFVGSRGFSATDSKVYVYTLSPGGPLVLRHPDPVVTFEGEPAEFSVEADGRGGELSYAWLKDGEPIPGAAGPVLRLEATGPGDTGVYNVVVTAAGVSATSEPAELRVQGIRVEAEEEVLLGVEDERRYGRRLATDGAGLVAGVTAAGVRLSERSIPGWGSVDVPFPFDAGNISSLAAGGDVVVVGMSFADGQLVDEGAAFVYERNPTGGWGFSVTLSAPVPQRNARFGAAVGVSGGTIAVGAPRDDLDGGDGAVYLFERAFPPGGGWVHRATLRSGGFDLGARLAIGGDVLVAGRQSERSPVTVFERDQGGEWVDRGDLRSSDGSTDVGGSLSLSGGRIFTGNSAENRVTVFERTPSAGWRAAAVLRRGDGGTGGNFGASVAAYGGEWVVVGKRGAGGRVGGGSGSVQVFQRQADGTWREAFNLVPRLGELGDAIGSAVAFDGEYLFVGDERGADEAGHILTFGLPGLAPRPAADPRVWFGRSGDPFLAVAEVTGSPEMTYRWFHEGEPVPGETGRRLRMVALAPGDAGRYTVTVANAHGSADFVAFDLVVDGSPLIAVQPAGSEILLNVPLTLSVDAAGDPPIGYQWFKDGTAVAGATSADLTIVAPSGADAGRYHVVVANAFGEVASEVAVVKAPEVEPHLVDDLALPGLEGYGSGGAIAVDLAVMADHRAGDGGEAVVFERDAATGRWMESTRLAGVAGVDPFDAFGSSVATDGETIAVGAMFAGEPELGAGAVYALRKGPLVWEVQKLVTPPGEGHREFGVWVGMGDGFLAALSLTEGPEPNVPIRVIHLYRKKGEGGADPWEIAGRVEVGDGAFDNERDAAAMRDGVIVVAFASGVGEGEREVYVLARDASEPLGWGAPARLPGPGFPTWDFGFSVATDGADVGVLVADSTGGPGRVVVYGRGDGAGGGWQPKAELVQPELGNESFYGRLAMGPGTVVVGREHDSTSVVEGAGSVILFRRAGPAGDPWSYHGKIQASPPGAGPSLGAAVALEGGRLMVSSPDPAGGWGARFYDLFPAMPRILSHPAGLVRFSGESATFRVEVADELDQTFQWLRGGSEIVGADGPELVVDPVGPGSAGDYAVRVSNAAGSVLSDLAQLVVDRPPEVVREPVGGVFHPGDAVVLEVGVGVGYGVTYQWFLNGLPLGGETRSALTIAGVSMADAGSYSALVENPAGAVASEAVDVAVVNQVDQPTQTIGWDEAVAGSSFGWALSFMEGQLAVGAPSFSVGDGEPNQGFAFLFEHGGGTVDPWVQTARLAPSPLGDRIAFGRDVALEGGRAVVGAPGADGAETGSGAAFVFERAKNGGWVQTARIHGSVGEENGGFGSALGLTGDWIVAGEQSIDIGADDAGAAFFFRRTVIGSWAEVSREGPEPADRRAVFGQSVAAGGGIIAVGAPGFDPPVEGGVFLYDVRDSPAAPARGALLRLDHGDGFGRSVATDGELLAAGGPASVFEPEAPRPVFIYRRTDVGFGWAEEAQLVASDAFRSQPFGNPVALDGNRVAVGARDACYLYERSAGGWVEVAKLVPPGGAAGMGTGFGDAVGVSGHWVAVGAKADDLTGENSGAVYLYDLLEVQATEGFSTWRRRRLEAAGAGLAESDPGADPNGDGLSNLMSFAAGIDPLAPARPRPATPAAGLFEAHPEGSAGAGFQLRYRRAKAALGLSFSLQRSRELVAWEPVANRHRVVGEEDDAWVMGVDLPAGDRYAFYRLVVQASE